MRDFLDILCWIPSSFHLSANNHNTDLPCSNQHPREGKKVIHTHHKLTFIPVGGDSMIIILLSVAFLPYSFGFSTLEARIIFQQKPVAEQNIDQNFQPSFTCLIFIQKVCFVIPLKFFAISSIDTVNQLLDIG